jgi:hypothetical protein
MFVPRLGQQLLMAIALGLILLPGVSWATTVTIPAPFNPETTAPASLSKLGDISINNDGGAAPATVYFGTYDINNNAVVFIPSVQDTAHGLALYNKVNDMVRSGADFSAYDGTGISSSLANIDANHGNNAMGIGVLYNDAAPLGFPGDSIWGTAGDLDGTTWMGFDPSPFDTLVSYTYLGDTLLRGKVTSFDVTETIFGKNGQYFANNTWASGDFFYQTTGGSSVNSFDVTTAIFGKNFTSAGTYPLTVTFSGAGASGSLSVPEPSSLLLAALGAIAAVVLASRGRGRRHEKC